MKESGILYCQACLKEANIATMPHEISPGAVEIDPVTGEASRSLASILAELRRLAVAALDSGHPLAAARIAGTADLLEAESLSRPPRPSYPGR